MANRFSAWMRKLLPGKKTAERPDQAVDAKHTQPQATPQSDESAAPAVQRGWFARVRAWYSLQAGETKRIWQELQADKPKPPKHPKPIGAVLDEERKEIDDSRMRRLDGLRTVQENELKALASSFGESGRANESHGKNATRGPSYQNQDAYENQEGGVPSLQPVAKAVNNDLVGVCFSGGGIRSATFNLGVTTGLASRGYLKQVDYLSTVSGGGYIGSWLTAWMKREGCQEVEERLSGRRGNVGKEKMRVPTVSGMRDFFRYQEPDPVRFLRRFSNYLAPKTGLLSTDLWALIAVYLRNVMLNLALLIAAGACVLALPLLGIHWGWRFLGDDLTAPFMVAIRVLLALAISAVAYSFASFSSDVKKDSKLAVIVDRPGWFVAAPLLLAAGLMTYILTPSLTEKIYCIAREIRISSEPDVMHWVIEGTFWYTGIWVLGTLVSQIFEVVALYRKGVLRNLRSIVSKLWETGKILLGKSTGPSPVAGSKTVSLLAALISGALGGLLLYAFGQFLAKMPATLWTSLDQQPGTIPFYGYAAFSTVLGPPLLLWTVALVSVLHVGLLGRSLPDAKREWLSRLCAMLALTALGWVVVMGLSLYGAVIFKFLFQSSWAHSTWGRVVKWILAGGWLTATAGGVIGGNMSKGAPQKGNGTTGIFLKLAPVVFILGLLLLLSFGVDWYLRSTPESSDVSASSAPSSDQYNSMIDQARDAASVGQFVDRFVDLMKRAAPPAARAAMDEAAREHWNYAATYLGKDSGQVSRLLLALIVIVLLLSWRLDVNEFSIHLLYRNRLARCYLGASRNSRKPQPFTGFDVEDDIPLASLRIRADKLPGIREKEDGLAKPYTGPYHILCTALNLVSGKELAWQTRKARSFIYSPLYCGYDYFRLEEESDGGARPGGEKSPAGHEDEEFDKLKNSAYRPTEWYSGEGGPYLGTALAISGAAATPNMGYHSSPALTFLMAVFNVRLGWWSGNTRHDSAWKKFGPRLALYLGLELAGRTDDENAFVYLSDGGHFENLGLYELVRRKCRYIIASDGSADPGYSFGDLGNAIQKCRRDLGAEISIDTSKLRPKKDERLCQAHYAFGRITYSDGSEGSLLYLKSSLTSSDRRDVQSFATDHPAFPHDSTADQFFNEDRFESYRALGEDVFKAVMNDVESELKRRRFTAAGLQAAALTGPQREATSPDESVSTPNPSRAPEGINDRPQVTASGAAVQPARQATGQAPQPPQGTLDAATGATPAAASPSAPLTLAGLFTALENIYSSTRPARRASFRLEEVNVARMRFSYETE